VSVGGYLDLLQWGAYCALGAAVGVIGVLIMLLWVMIYVRRLENELAVFTGARPPHGRQVPPPGHPAWQNPARPGPRGV
jgi:hypothetical protein